MNNILATQMSMAKKAISNPKKAMSVALFDPSRLVGGTKSSGNEYHKNQKLVRAEQKLDLRNNLSYRSPSNRKRYPVDDSVTHGMINRRRKEGAMYVPHPSDELAHILAHCIFDKKSNFSEYYVERTSELLEIIETDEDNFELLKEILNTVFYSAGDYVLELTREQRYDNMLEELRQFHEY